MACADAETHRYCNECGVTKKIDDFRMSKGYRTHTCRECQASEARRIYHRYRSTKALKGTWADVWNALGMPVAVKPKKATYIHRSKDDE